MSNTHQNTTRIAERQMRNWELSRHQHLAYHEEEAAGTIRFYIAVSRELGSQGEEVADHLAQSLNWPKYDREILTYMSEQEEVRRRIYESLDERRRNWLQQLIDLLEPMGVDGIRTRDEYFSRMCRSVITIAQHQHAIFVGRGTNFILPASRGLSVRIVAPLQRRIARVMEMTGLSEREARRRIYEVEAQRAEFLVTHFGSRPYDPRRYDLVVNAGAMSVLDMSCLIRKAAECKLGKALSCEKPLA